MFGIGWTEFVLVALVLLIFVGPKHLPDMLKKFGRIMGELRAASRELRNQLDVEMRDLESPSKIMRDVASDISEAIPSPYDSVSRAEKALQKEAREIAETVRAEPEATAETEPKATKAGENQEDSE